MTNVGIDLVEISRFKDKLNNNSFISSIFNPQEIEYISKHNSLDTIAGLFAAKEAMLKALKKGINNYSLKDIEIIHDDNNAPSILLHNSLKNDFDIKHISLSISHDGNYATAIVLITM